MDPTIKKTLKQLEQQFFEICDLAGKLMKQVKEDILEPYFARNIELYKQGLAFWGNRASISVIVKTLSTIFGQITRAGVQLRNISSSEPDLNYPEKVRELNDLLLLTQQNLSIKHGSIN